MTFIPARGRPDLSALLNLPLSSSPSENLTRLKRLANLTHVERRLAMLHSQDPFINSQKDRIRKLAHHPEPVLITGPTGTGKELLASACVSPSYRDSESECPFVAINCGSISRNLVESTFFGHVKGAFTGADTSTKGLLEKAGNGIIFLDEIGELPLPNQASLLRAIQENEIYPVGSTTTIKINCRFVAATKYTNMLDRIENGLFRDDLYARISTYRIHTTSLRDRPLDIPYISGKLGWTDPLPNNSLDHIYRYNVRGLQAVIANLKVFGEWIEHT